jgi:lysophospholipase L1-like esterase
MLIETSIAPSPYDQEFRAFAEEARRGLIPPNPILFYGSSSIRLWSEQVLTRFEQFVASVRARLGWKPIVFISVKPSPARFWNVENIRRANALIREASALRWHEVQWLDVFSLMLDSTGGPRRDLFGEDGLHLNRAGYAVWRDAIRAAFIEAGLSP